MTQAPVPEPPPQPASEAPAPSKRPGGLTALAVINFVIGGLAVIGSLLGLAALKAVETLTVEVTGEGIQAARQEAPSAGVVYLSLVLGLVAAVLLIVSGVGYIKQKKGLGWGMGHAYAVVGIVYTIIGLAALSTGLGFFQIVGLAYPVVTLVLLNTVFKKAFVY